ncbi:MAG: oligoendopeptidase F [Cellvibrionales bacterium]|nr:MAG: oligoendopeptidase F [Cellvibrionales bacterium]
MTFTPHHKILLLLVISTLLLPAWVQGKDVPERIDIDERYKWDLSDMYRDTQAWEVDREKFIAVLPTLERFRGQLSTDGPTLLAAIEAMQSVETIIANLYVYAGLRSYEDTRVSENAARFSEAQSLYARYQETLSFFTPELLAIPEHTLSQFLASTPGLAVYNHYLKEIARMRPYTLSEAEEKLLAMASDPLDKFDSVFTAIDSSDLQFGTVIDSDGNEVELTNSRYGAFLHSTDRRVREDAWTGLFKGYNALNHTLAANYEGHVKSRVFFARARGFESRLEHATYVNAIPVEIFNNLLTTAKAGSEPLQRYLKLRKEALGVERLEIWDMYAPIVPPTMADISFEDAKQLVADALTPLGQEYINIYWKGFEEGWVDTMANRGKRGGAYSWGTYTSKPYLSMNYEGTLNNVSTLAHEYGHSIHSYLTRSNQPQVYGDYKTFIAEVASMTNEAILMQKMLSEASSAGERAYLLSSYLDEFRGGFYRQASFADFEARAHAKVEAGEALTADLLNNLYADVFADYYGDAVHANELNQVEWSRIPHFLRSDNFYVYQYSTSFVAATALAKMIIEEGEPARERYLTMLKSGSNDYPIALLKKAGIDMTSTAPMEATIAVFDDLVDQLEVALDEMNALAVTRH